MIQVLNFKFGQHCTLGGETPISLLKAVKLFHLQPALLVSADGRSLRKNRFLAEKRGKISLLLPWYTGYTNAAAACRRGATGALSEYEAFKKHRQHAGTRGKSTAARARLEVGRALTTEKTFDRVRWKFWSGEAVVVATAAETAVASSQSALDSGREAAWPPDNAYDLEIIVEVIKSRDAFIGGGQ